MASTKGCNTSPTNFQRAAHLPWAIHQDWCADLCNPCSHWKLPGPAAGSFYGPTRETQYGDAQCRSCMACVNFTPPPQWPSVAWNQHLKASNYWCYLAFLGATSTSFQLFLRKSRSLTPDPYNSHAWPIDEVLQRCVFEEFEDTI